MDFSFNFALFFTALGLAFVIESMPWILSPSSIRKLLETLSEMPDEVLRSFALTMFVIGLLIMFIATKNL